MDRITRKQQIADSLRRLANSYVQGIRQLEETLAVLCREFELQEIDWSDLISDFPTLRPKVTVLEQPLVADLCTFSVIWRGKACFLGNTLLFKLFEKLARRPNRYCPHTELLDEVWGGPRSDSSIRNVAKRLRDRLSAAGMRELAQAIDGSEPGHYALRLDRIK